LRRAYVPEAGLLAARASYLARFSWTSTVRAAPQFGIPIYGTMAHSFVQAHEDEMAAFERVAYANADIIVLLIDTADTEAGAANVVSLASWLREKGIAIQGVRLDSGDLAEHARKVRRILDEGGLTDAVISASGNLDESSVRQLVAVQARLIALASVRAWIPPPTPPTWIMPTSWRSTLDRRIASVRKGRPHGPAASRYIADMTSMAACPMTS
jgi:nicotinate phosphoribosyltransferase